MPTGFLGRLAPNLLANRRRPPLASLASETDPERFVWLILPHAARTFGLAIALLPTRLARPLAAAYLWCRALDTIEDLAPDAAAREHGFAACVVAATEEAELPPLQGRPAQDDRDRAHLLLVARAPLLARFTATLGADARARLVALVVAMARGMDAAGRIREAAGGVLGAGPGREAYCRAVLSEPLFYAEAELRAQGGDAPPDAARRALADAAGEIIQLANVCRDVETDLARGTAYDELLRPHVAAGIATADVVAQVRVKILGRVAELSPALEPYFGGLPLSGRPGARAAAAVMYGATASFFQRANRRLAPSVLTDVGAPSAWTVACAAAAAFRSQAAALRTFHRLKRAFEPACRPGKPCVANQGGRDAMG